MTKPELAVWTAYYIELSPEEAVTEMKKHGITAAELSDEHGEMLLRRGDPVKTGEEFRAFLEKEQFTMTQGHLWLHIRLCSDPEAFEKLCPWLDLYHAIGIRCGVLHVDSLRGEPALTEEERMERNISVLRKVDEYLGERDFQVCLENVGGIAASAEQLNTMIDRLGDRHFAVCLDTGHLNLAADKDQVRFIETVGSRLRALHIADNEGERDQHLMPFGRGNIDFIKIAAALRQIGYAGLFNLEIPGERLAPMPVRGYKLEYIRKCYDYLFSL
ncbi:MAG: sugar phosphate isomerase/epimerase [Clostridia bacterium]|nr:sugar phosphate isomerase/epimerase [Clostridia bacterium]